MLIKNCEYHVSYLQFCFLKSRTFSSVLEDRVYVIDFQVDPAEVTCSFCMFIQLTATNDGAFKLSIGSLQRNHEMSADGTGDVNMGDLKNPPGAPGDQPEFEEIREQVS